MSELLAGRELDALVAERVMGWHREGVLLWPPDCKRTKWVHGVSVPPYSTQMAFAWEVVEKLKERVLVIVGGGPNDEGGCEDWYCTVKSFGYRQFQDQEWSEVANTAPLAICRAALKTAPPFPESAVPESSRPAAVPENE